MGTDKDTLSPIACEPCRQRKCKCDRTLPSCSQCAEPSKCNYPESGKRGLPLGYLTQLEQRLADTELALFEALATLRSLGHNDKGLVKASLKAEVEAKQGKHARMKEWGRLPLRDPADIRGWWQAKEDQYTCEQGSLRTQAKELDPALEDTQSTELGGSVLGAQRQHRTDAGAISAEASADGRSMMSSSSEDRTAGIPSNEDLRRQIPQHSLGIHLHRSLGEHDGESRPGIPRSQEDGAEPASTDRASILASTRPSLYF
ncbi:hypothetical protein BO94DRAFT_23471 [Aspergillus sclerotioniger CBS 115572]|uniref:Zn(2)-C6 fungal-type domain-containing protein n=1 Tax=Aspergillus sclerotioniger CBS 115572 TaxID=1450535 RepID=A0A317X065_9EURO|nr:hypothetical protein BO94DRAFT_23471 [Aspergillus sclerotioniger CBS 115572]PWY90368.1 hypothetical protein BO94DRAFT_23471 [Aspergillus sclerotioniger CBS 115572]